MPKFNVEVTFEVEAETAEEAFGFTDARLNNLHLEGRLPGHYEMFEGAATCQTGEYDSNFVCTNCNVHLDEHN